MLKLRKGVKMEKASRFNDQFFSSLGSVISDSVVSKDFDENKYFAVVAKCGHVGDGYFVPILFSTYAKDKESAKQIVRNLPRVKNHVRDCILATKEISKLEDIFIKAINRYDPYLTYSAKKGNMESRRIVTLAFLEDARKGYRDRRLAERRLVVKVADEYPQYLTLQKYFAPSMIDDKIVFPKNVDMDFLLKDYFVERTRYLGVKRGIASILVCFYKLFGPDNQFGVELDDEKLTYIGEDGKKHFIDIENCHQSTLNLESDSRLVDAIKAKSPKVQEDFTLVEKVEGKAKSGLERFHERMQKTKKFQKGWEGEIKNAKNLAFFLQFPFQFCVEDEKNEFNKKLLIFYARNFWKFFNCMNEKIFCF